MTERVNNRVILSGGQLAVRNPSHTDCHGGHCDQVQTFDAHHVVEQSEGGESVAENYALICPNTHRNTHDLYRLYDKLLPGQPLPWGTRRHFPRISRRMAAARQAAKAAGAHRPLDQNWRLY